MHVAEIISFPSSACCWRKAAEMIRSTDEGRFSFQVVRRAYIRMLHGNAGFEDIVPVVLAGAGPFDTGVEKNQRVGHLVADGVGIETAIDLIALTDKLRQPAGVWPGS